MRTVHKFPFPSFPTERAVKPMTVDVGWPAIVRHVSVDPSGDGFVPCLWIEHSENETRREERRFQFIGTGHQVPVGAIAHHGSVVTPRGLVWHVYEVR